ncbi:cell pattern formation-associated protein stuA, partial [Blumeria hordei DH14]
MNHQSADMYYPSHLSAGQPNNPQNVSTSSLAHYSPHHQPPLLQPGPSQYGGGPSSYSHYGSYAHGIASPQPTGHNGSNALCQQSNVLPLPPNISTSNNSLGNNGYGSQQGFDMTGQVAPHGMKPRVTATLWEDEGSLCFQVEAKGVCVARREDNHMINGTKLLNVAGMTRGRRDGILKSEKMRHVVKIGPMHLKGVWIPFERALDFANKEKITELLYPLFVHNIGALLYHPTNQTRTNAVMAAAERRKQEQNQMRNSQAPGLPSLHQHHHHSMSVPMAGMSNGPPPVLAPHQHMGRGSLDRGQSFPTPPTSASSVMGNMGNSDGNFQWGHSNSLSNVPVNSALSIDTGLSNTRSMPNTPASTPPGSNIQGLQYQQSNNSYDATRHMYNSSNSQHHPYSQNTSDHSGMPRYPTTNYLKTDMAPPARSSVPDNENHTDTKDSSGILHHGNNHAPQAPDEEREHDQEAEYTHGSTAHFEPNRAPYNYNPGSTLGSLAADHSHLSEITASPSHSNSGRATPRTANNSQTFYSQPGGYHTPPRALPPSSNLYNVMSADRGASTNNNVNDLYT